MSQRKIGAILILNTDLGSGRRLRRPEKSQICFAGCRGRQPLRFYGDFRVRQTVLSGGQKAKDFDYLIPEKVFISLNACSAVFFKLV